LATSKTRVLILGAGFGGLELASRLAEDLPDRTEVALIDQSDHFMFGFSKLDVMFGRRAAAEVRCSYRDLQKPNLTFHQEHITEIDPEQKRVVTDRGTHEADVLVVALGADLDPGATPGFVAGGHEFYSPEGAEALRPVVESFEGGVAVVGVLGSFFKCPPAPCEAALMLDHYLRERGRRHGSEIKILSPLGIPIPISTTTSEAVLGVLAERGIEYSGGGGSRVARLEPGSGEPGSGEAVTVDGRKVAYDLFLGIPVHKAPPVVEASALAVDGWIPVDQNTFATAFPDVYAVGDVASVPMPRAGVVAEGEARTLADVLVAQLAGGDDPAPFAGELKCYIDFGDDTVATVDANFLSGPQPTAVFNPASAEQAAEKEQFGSSRRRRWFGP